MKSTDGIVEVLPGAARPDSPRDFCFVMIWRDLDVLRAFVGDDIDTPHIDAAESALVETRRITHYDLVPG
ncbi:hypothetical protein [Roseivivax sp. CAU 1753]